ARQSDFDHRWVGRDRTNIGLDRYGIFRFERRASRYRHRNTVSARPAGNTGIERLASDTVCGTGTARDGLRGAKRERCLEAQAKKMYVGTGILAALLLTGGVAAFHG